MTTKTKRKAYPRGAKPAPDRALPVNTPIEGSASPPIASVRFREDVEAMVCSNPECDHTAHDGLYLHQACHPLKGVYTSKTGTVLHIRCAVCDKPVVGLAVGEYDFLDHASATCTHDHPFYAYYKDGWLTLKCANCEQDLYRMSVLARSTPTQVKGAKL